MLVKCHCVLASTEILKVSATTITVMSTVILIMRRLCYTHIPILQLPFTLKKAL